MTHLHIFGKLRVLPVLGTSLLMAASLARAELVMHPKQVGASIDLGQLQSGYTADQGLKVDGLPITRTGVYLTVSGTYDEKLDILLTTGGLFWYASSVKVGDVVNRTLKFGPGVGQAQAIYHFGGKAANASRLQFGLFPIKYSDAHNLGEYLYRSGTYPGYEVTGGWSYLNAANYLAQGVRYTLPTFDGMVVHDFTAFMERGWEPLHDISPGYALTVKPTRFLEVGGGVVWSHAIPLKKGDGLSPKRINNAYSKTTGMPVAGASEYGVTQTPVYDSTTTPPTFIGFSNDTTATEALTLRDWQACQSGDCSNIGYYTFRGFKGALRASVDLGNLIDNTMFRANDFKLYGEVALLGFKNYPYYYEDRMERMPIMAGLNIPTFGWLNRLSAEVEYRKSKFRNSIYGVNRETVPVPTTDIDGTLAGYNYIGAENTDDDWRWSFYASRQITEGVTLTGQVASDHQRHPDFWGVFGYQPATQTTKDWYYVVRLDFGMF